MYSWLCDNRDDADKFSHKEFDEAYNSLLIKKELQIESLLESYNTPYVLCKNGVLNLENMSLKKMSPKYEFSSAINANYNEDCDGKYFNEFIDFATKNDKDLKKLIQEIMGYALSNYTHLRTAFMFLGVKGSGKSTLLDIIRCLCGEANVSAVDIKDMEQEYYISKILKSKLNIVSDVSERPIKGEISSFKSLVSDSDVVTGRDPREQPFSSRCRTKMLFGSNHHLNFIGISHDDLEAFFDRMIYIPFDRTIINRIEGYGEKLKNEYDYIFTWAMQGMKRLMENKFKFTECQASYNLKRIAISQYCPEEIFFCDCLKKVEKGRYACSSDITDAFKKFCKENDLKGNFNICTYLERRGYNKHRKRINKNGDIVSSGNPVYVYEGIRLRKKYID